MDQSVPASLPVEPPELCEGLIDPHYNFLTRFELTSLIFNRETKIETLITALVKVLDGWSHKQRSKSTDDHLSRSIVMEMVNHHYSKTKDFSIIQEMRDMLSCSATDSPTCTTSNSLAPQPNNCATVTSNNILKQGKFCNEVLSIDSLVFRVFQFVDLDSLINCGRVSKYWLYKTYSPSPIYKLDSRFLCRSTKRLQVQSGDSSNQNDGVSIALRPRFKTLSQVSNVRCLSITQWPVEHEEYFKYLMTNTKKLETVRICADFTRMYRGDPDPSFPYVVKTMVENNRFNIKHLTLGAALDANASISILHNVRLVNLKSLSLRGWGKHIMWKPELAPKKLTSLTISSSLPISSWQRLTQGNWLTNLEFLDLSRASIATNIVQMVCARSRTGRALSNQQDTAPILSSMLEQLTNLRTFYCGSAPLSGFSHLDTLYFLATHPHMKSVESVRTTVHSRAQKTHYFDTISEFTKQNLVAKPKFGSVNSNGNFNCLSQLKYLWLCIEGAIPGYSSHALTQLSNVFSSVKKKLPVAVGDEGMLHSEHSCLDMDSKLTGELAESSVEEVVISLSTANKPQMRRWIEFISSCGVLELDTLKYIRILIETSVRKMTSTRVNRTRLRSGRCNTSTSKELLDLMDCMDKLMLNGSHRAKAKECACTYHFDNILEAYIRHHYPECEDTNLDRVYQIEREMRSVMKIATKWTKNGWIKCTISIDMDDRNWLNDFFTNQAFDSRLHLDIIEESTVKITVLPKDAYLPHEWIQH